MHSVANLMIYLISYYKILPKLNNLTMCVVFVGITLVTLSLEIYFAYKSKKEKGIPLGILPVGCFYID